MASLHTLAFEIGTEEIPAFDLHKATAQLEKLVPEALDAVRIPHGAVSVHTTPRRLIVLAEDVADETEALQEVFRGPSAKIAFDAEGKPTKAAIGFARGKGLDVDALERREENGVEYVFAERSVPARDVAELLPGVLEGVITGISWPKSCRWGTRGEYFSRPVRWLVALLDEGKPLPVELRDQLIYFVGPCPAPPGRPIGSAGPTTSGRMDAYSPRLIADCGLRGMIGKGNRSAAVIDAMKQYGAVYFAATGGAGALIARCIRKCEIIAFPDLGPEAIHRLEVENFPLVVAIDSLGNNLYH